MRNFIKILPLILIIIFSSVSESYVPTYDMKNYYSYNKEAGQLAAKIHKYKDKLNLEYKSFEDLKETCYFICQHTKYKKNISKYDVASMIAVESKFNPNARSKKGALGLMQLYNYKKDYKEELIFVQNPFDKNQNILGGITILSDKMKRYKDKDYAKLRYCGKPCEDSRAYVRKVNQIKYQLMKG